MRELPDCDEYGVAEYASVSGRVCLWVLAGCVVLGALLGLLL